MGLSFLIRKNHPSVHVWKWLLCTDCRWCFIKAIIVHSFVCVYVCVCCQECESCLYELRAVVCHVRSTEGPGNLVAHILTAPCHSKGEEGGERSERRWYLFNDFVIQPLSKVLPVAVVSIVTLHCSILSLCCHYWCNLSLSVMSCSLLPLLACLVLGTGYTVRGGLVNTMHSPLCPD